MKLQRHLAAALILVLFGCDSATDPGNGGPTYQLTDTFPAELAEFFEEEGAGRLRFNQINFSSGTADLTDSDKEVLDKFAEVFGNLPGARFVIEAHTDSRGSEADNLRLSRDRANSVRNYLKNSVGGPGPYMEAEGFGETVPIDTNATANGRARNRRVEVVVHYRSEPMTRFILEAGELDVLLDCDANPDPETEQPGDFYITLSVRVSNRVDDGAIKEISRHLVQANDGEKFDVGLAIDAPVLQAEGDLVEVYVEIEEFDGGTSWSIRRAELFRFEYQPDLGCWEDVRAKTCGVPGNGTIVVRDSEVTGVPCELTFDWTLRTVDVP